MRGLAILLVSVTLGLQGCASRGCSEVGGFDGITVEISHALFVATGSVTVEVCDADGCASATQRLGPVPEGRVGREASVTFDDLGRSFEPDQVAVTVELNNSKDEAVASARQDVQLTRSYPNGKSCDGEGYVGGTLALDADDRL